MACKIEDLVNHPLALLCDVDAETGRFNGVWSERHIEGIQTFTVMCKPTGNFGDVSGISSDVATCKIYDWMARRGMLVHVHNMCLMEPHEKRLWPLDFVAEVANVPVIVQVYCSERRRGQARLDMEEYCREIRRICLEVYKLPLDVLLVNVYFGENTVSLLVSAVRDDELSDADTDAPPPESSTETETTPPAPNTETGFTTTTAGTDEPDIETPPPPVSVP